LKKMISCALYGLYGTRSRSVRRMVLHLVPKLEGGELLSGTLRAIFRDFHNVEIGLYSYGWFSPARIAPHTIIGRYCSIGPGVCILPQNHPLTFKSTHPYFYNPLYGCLKDEVAPVKKLVIGNDVWIGQNAIILPQVRSIGDGAIIGAGAVVTKDVAEYAVVAGNPARLIKHRFSPEKIARLKEERWWLKSLEELKENLDEFARPYEGAEAWRSRLNQR
jgi:virginiamycin A acetyltransferase